MKRFQLFIIFLAAVVTLYMMPSCKKKCIKGSGNQITETRKMTEFTKVDVSDGFRIVLKQDSSLTLKITADDNLLKYIKTEVSGGKLSISTPSKLCSSGEMTIVIGLHKLESFNSSGAVDLRSDGRLNTQDVTLGLSGAAKVNLDLNAANVITNISGLTDLSLKGQATSHDIKITGTGKINALDFVTGNSDIEISGIGHCGINVLNTLSVHSTGIADVKYKGNPSKVTNDNTGAASVTKIN